MNRYFITNVTNPNISEIYHLVVGSESTQRFSLDGKKVVVKLPIGDLESHGVLQNVTEYTHAEILVEMLKPEWVIEL